MREELPNLLQSLFCPYTCHICDFEGSQADMYVLTPHKKKIVIIQHQNWPQGTWRQRGAVTGPRVQHNLNCNTTKSKIQIPECQPEYLCHVQMY